MFHGAKCPDTPNLYASIVFSQKNVPLDNINMLYYDESDVSERVDIKIKRAWYLSLMAFFKQRV